jgi:heme exporter protein A
MAASTCIDLTAPSSLAVEELSLWRGDRLLFRDLAFSLNAGDVLSLEAPNGAGKTSLLRAIAGFLEPQTGRIVVRGADGSAFASSEDRAPFIGWLGHHDGLKSQLTPVETLAFFARYYRSAESVEDALAAVGLSRMRDLPVQYLSAGQKRRLSLARLRVTARPIWLLDEPFAALDKAGKALAAEFIAAHVKGGGLAVAATHEPLGLPSARLTLGNAP